MKISIARFLLCLLVIGLPVMAQNRPQEPANKPHETVVDGRWEVKGSAEEKPTTVFEFKKVAGGITGIMIQDGKSVEIRDGKVDGTELKFQTVQVSGTGGEPITMTWTGAISRDGNSISLTCEAVATDGARGKGKSLQMEAQRVKK